MKKYEIILPVIEKTSDYYPTSSDFLAISNSSYPLVSSYKIIPTCGRFDLTEEIKVIFELTNANSKMDTCLAMNIQRPTNQLILCVTFPENLKVKNIQVKRKLLFGDYKDEILSKKKYSLIKKTHGTTSSGKGITHKVIIEHPEMFYSYSLCWNWK